MKKRTPYTTSEAKFILDAYAQGKNQKEITRLHNECGKFPVRTYDSISGFIYQSRQDNHPLAGFKFTKEMDKYLEDNCKYDRGTLKGMFNEKFGSNIDRRTIAARCSHLGCFWRNPPVSTNIKAMRGKRYDQ